MTIHIFRQCYSARINALQAIGERDADALENSANEVKHFAAVYDGYMPGAELEGFAEALRCLALQRRWLNATRNAEPEADRFQKAVKLRVEEYGNIIANRDSTVFDEIVSEIGSIETYNDLESAENQLASTPMPFSATAPKHLTGIRSDRETKGKSERTEIAFMKFDINGAPAKTLDTLTPNVAHDMLLHLRVSNWPETAERLIVEPVSLEPSDCYNLPKFVIDRPNILEGPMTFERNGRLILKLAQPIGAKPYEFKFRAVFDPGDMGFIDLLGHRTLKLESLDPTRCGLSGYANIDAKILSIRRQLTSLPGIPDSELFATMRLLSGIGNIAGQALQDAVFPHGMKEKLFQKETLKMLRANPKIGSDLEEHPSAGGGITELSLDKIRLELKVENDCKPTKERLSKYEDQTAQYVIGSGKRLGILCVLDTTVKSRPPASAEDLIFIQKKNLSEGFVVIVTVIIQGGLSRPSDLSK